MLIEDTKKHKQQRKGLNGLKKSGQRWVGRTVKGNPNGQ